MKGRKKKSAASATAATDLWLLVEEELVLSRELDKRWIVHVSK